MNRPRYPSSLDRLEAKIEGHTARIDAQAGRIDDLYRLLESRGILGDAVEQPEEGRCRPRRLRSTRSPAGNAARV